MRFRPLRSRACEGSSRRGRDSRYFFYLFFLSYCSRKADAGQQEAGPHGTAGLCSGLELCPFW